LTTSAAARHDRRAPADLCERDLLVDGEAIVLTICLVTDDPWGTGRAVSERLRLGGHAVTVLDTRDGAVRKGASAAEEGLAPAIRLVACPVTGPRVIGYPRMTRAYRAWRWCKGRSFDAICYAEAGGAGYFVALARRLGLDFHGTTLVACCEGPTLWRLAGNGRLPTGGDLAADHMERASVAWADAAVCASSALMDWMRHEQWTLPPATRVAPQRVFPVRTAHAAANAGSFQEVVFVGSLERRSGLVAFVQALRRLPSELTAGLTVTFLGETPRDDNPWPAESWLAAAMPGGLAWRIADRTEAARPYEYLSAAGRLAVAPGLTEGLPAFVAECLARSLAFLACDTADTRELVHSDDWALALCLPDPPALAVGLGSALLVGFRPPRAAVNPVARAGEDDWSRVVPDAVARRSLAGFTPGLPPSIIAPELTVVLTHRNRPRLLFQALDALRRQTFRNFEIILVDDGSDAPDALELLDALGPEFDARGWRIIRQSNRYLGAARNRGWRTARARLVMFHDDDNVATPRQIERLVAAARCSGAAVVTSAFGLLEGPDPPEEETPGYQSTVIPFLGGALARGFFENCFGDAQALVRRDVLEALGGFSEDFGVGHEDWEFFARAALAGHEVLALPEPLFWYRVSSDSMLRARPDIEPDLARSARAYMDLLPPALRPILLASLALGRRAEEPPV
jgi:GT2 family glycosyltransferase